MNTLIRFTSIFLALAVTTSAWAGGGWVSSGGELFKDAHNPWFLRNKPSVSYCVKVAAGSVSLDVAKVEEDVRASLEHWMVELKRASIPGEGNVELGMQKFTKVECSTQTDLRFLIGYETLSKEEIDYLEEPTKFIGVTVRTDYDPVTLTGKGFVFISSDFGPNSYDNPGNLIERAWSQPKLFKYALLHEIGHVFGLPHAGSGLMSEAFLEQMLNKNLAPMFSQMAIPSFFEPPSEIEVCDAFSSSARTWLAIPAGDQCVLMKQTMNRWVITSKAKGEAPQTKLGDLIATTPDILDYQTKPAIFVNLTSEQKVFSPKETMFRSFMFGPMLKEFGVKSNFVIAPGQSKSAYVRITPSSLLVTGIVNGKVELLVSYVSPIGVAILKDPSPLHKTESK
ncbi:MAG: hypothetical protein V4692_07875 [Bdellovibrionota bacterium]